MKNIIKLDIPFFWQKNSLSDKVKNWERKICWLACIKMCIEYFNWISPELEELLKFKNHKYRFLNINSWEEKKYNYHLKWIGWLHYWLLAIIKKYWLFWVVEKIDSQNTETIFKKYLSQNLCILASVNLNFSYKENKWWHLVVVKWLEENEEWSYIIINDPIKEIWDYKINIIDFINNFSGNLILISDKNNEWFSSNSPIYIDSYKKILSQNSDKFIFFHIHENEELALKETIKFIRKNWDWKVFYLNENWERFLRYEIRNDNNEKIFIRIDPNRIFDNEELIKTIVDRNNHLDLKYLDKAIFIGKNIRNYIINSLALQKDKNYVCIHTNKLLNINNFKWKSDEIFINENLPNNAFIIVWNKEDFMKLKELWINVIYYKNENDWSLRDYLQKNWYRSFTIESWAEDKKTFRYLLKKIYEIVN